MFTDRERYLIAEMATHLRMFCHRLHHQPGGLTQSEYDEAIKSLIARLENSPAVLGAKAQEWDLVYNKAHKHENP